MNKKIKYTTVTVPLGDRTYPIYIGANILSKTGDFCKKHAIYSSIVILSDTNVAKLYLPTVVPSLKKSGFNVRSIVIPPGEKQKSIRRAEKIYTQFMKWNVERSTTVIALGGGVIGDLGGFIAATYQRGIGFVQIPTSLLAQVDSSVGGKVGINHPLAKNMIGAFYQPKFVLTDTAVLQTLAQREIVCGLGEIVKYGIILDRQFFLYIRENISKALHRDRNVFAAFVKRSCELKAYVVSNDEREQGLRSALNFGHTIGHAMERTGKYSILKHGEAILFGMIAETNIALQRSMITQNDVWLIESVIRSIPLPHLSKMSFRAKNMIATMHSDKKSLNGEIRMVLPTAIGRITLPIPTAQKTIVEAISYLKEYGP